MIARVVCALGKFKSAISPKSLRNDSLLIAIQSAAFTFAIALVSGLVPEWGRWYSESIYHRLQTDALLRGNLCLSDCISDLDFDLTWSEKGVHQVWGLGVPILRLPFEVFARLFGFAAFPDRVVILAYLFFAVFLLCHLVFQQVRNPKIDRRSGSSERAVPLGGDAKHLAYVGIAAMGILVFLVFFPPFLTLLRTRMLVYEEVIAYGYLWSLILLGLLISFFRRRSTLAWFLLCAAAGFAGFVRPTIAAYGFASVIVAGFILVRYGSCRSAVNPIDGASPSAEVKNSMACERIRSTGQKENENGPTSRADWRRMIIRRELWIGMVILLMAVGALLGSNRARFGGFLEFGHKLNVQHLYGSLYATRFDDPFQTESFWSATKETFGALFFVKEFDGNERYRPRIFPFQSATLRWREFYFSTFDLSYLLIVLLGWVSGASSLVKVWQNRCESNRDDQNLLALSSVFGVWSVVSFIPLFAFYLKVPVISSRYMCDFMPSFSSAGVAAWCGVAALVKGSQHGEVRRVVLLFGALCVWVSYEFSKSFSGGPPMSASWREIEKIKSRSTPIPACTLTANEYTIGDRLGSYGIPFNGAGWNSSSGDTQPCVIFFVSNPQYLELEVIPKAKGGNEMDLCDAVRARIGLEPLPRDSVIPTGSGWRIRFRLPDNSRHTAGVHPLFLTFAPREKLAEDFTLLRLARVTWGPQIRSSGHPL